MAGLVIRFLLSVSRVCVGGISNDDRVIFPIFVGVACDDGTRGSHIDMGGTRWVRVSRGRSGMF